MEKKMPAIAPFNSEKIDSKALVYLFLVTGILLQFFLISIPARAQEEDDVIDEPSQECVDGQWVISVTTISALREKAVQAVDAVSDTPLEVKEESPHAILLSEKDSNSSGTTFNYQTAQNPCEDLRRQRRADLRAARETGQAKIIRRLTCSCNSVFHTTAVPNDQYYYLQWGYNQANDIDINMPEAWDKSQGSNSVVMGIIDTGVDYNHPDLAANIWTNPGEVPGNGVDDDHNGYVDDVHGWNAISGNGNPLDDNGHGTHCAGVIGARSNNGTGVAGINWNIKMVPIKFLSSTGSGSLYDAITAVDYATALKNQGINIIGTSNSWGGGGYVGPLYDAIVRAKNAGLIFIAAAGNDNNNNDANPTYPAGYNVDNVVSVAAVDNNGNRASFSNYGATSVDIAAPGVQIASTYINGGYVYLSGTSMATPHVSGAVALLKAYAPNLNWLELKNRLLQYGRPLNSLNGVVSTAKLLNVSAMLASVDSNPPASPSPTPSPTQTPAPSPTATPTPATPTPTPTPATPTPTPTPTVFAVSGTVTVNNGNTAVASAKVLLHTSKGDQVRFTGPSGQYSFAQVDGPGTVTITVSKPGYQFSVYNQYLSTTSSVNINGVARTYKLSALVLSNSKQPIPNAVISVSSFGSKTTDSQGVAVFDIPFGTDYTLSAIASGYQISGPFSTGRVLGDVTRVFAGAREQ